METVIKDILLEWGPLAIGWVVAGFLIWKTIYQTRKDPSPASLETLEENLDECKEHIYKIRESLAKLEVKVDTMWNFTLRRGISEIVMNNMGEVNSPVVFTDKAEEIIQPLVPALRELAKKPINGVLVEDLPEDDIAIIIEQELGDRVLLEVCIPNGLHLGACLLIAVEALKGRLACND